jgi:hypothetical protein
LPKELVEVEGFGLTTAAVVDSVTVVELLEADEL